MDKTTIFFSIPKTYNFNIKLNSIRRGGYAWYETKRKPKQHYDDVLVLWGDRLFWFSKYETTKGIGFYEWKDTTVTDIKGFQGFRYVNFYETWNKGVKYYD